MQLTVDEVFEGIKESDSISEVKTRPLEINARFVKLRELEQFAFVYSRKYRQYFLFSDNKGQCQNPSEKYDRIMDLWAIKEDGTTVLIRPALFINVVSPTYTSENSAPKPFTNVTIVSDDGCYVDIEESWGHVMKIFDEEEAATTVGFFSNAIMTIENNRAPNPDGSFTE